MTDCSLGELAGRIGVELRGDADTLIDHVAPLDRADQRAVCFLTNPRYRKHLKDTCAAAVILTPEHAARCATNVLVTSNPYLAYARAASFLHPRPRPAPGVHSSAAIDASASIDATASIGAMTVLEADVVVEAGAVVGPGCVLRRDVHVGKDSEMIANVTLCAGVKLGRRVLIHPGVVVGADGFGFANDQGVWIKVPQLGSVLIGDDVEIGANTTIDRGALIDTVIDNGVKLDNQVQVAHNVRIGIDTAIAGCVGIAGSTRIGKRCSIGGGVGILGHLDIVDDVQITAMSLVTRSLEKPGVYSSGTPLEPNRRWHRNFLRIKQLDEMARRLKAVEEELAQLRADK